MQLIYTAKCLIPGDAPPFERGALLANAGKITAVGPLAEVKRSHPGVRVIDYGDGLIVPVLVNAHTHLELTDYPIWAEQVGETEEPKDFVDWILRLIRVKRPLAKQRFHDSLANGIAQSIAAGTGAIGDILSHYPSRTAYQGAPLLGIIYLESLGQDPAVIQRVKQGLKAVLREQQVGSLDLGVSPHSPYSISGNYMASLYKLARDEDLSCCTHLAESPEEVEFLEKSRGGLTSKLYPAIGWESLIPRAAGCNPTDYLAGKGGLFPRNLLIHGVQLTAGEISLIAKNNMSLALCPRSNARLKVGKPPVAALLRAGVQLALGTDSLASNDSLSIWDEMAFAQRWLADQIDAPSLFQMATQGGAAALGLEKQIGSLAVGKDSSFQVLQPKEPVTIKELADYLVAPGRTAEIVQVYHQGRALLSGLPESAKG